MLQHKRIAKNAIVTWKEENNTNFKAILYYKIIPQKYRKKCHILKLDFTSMCKIESSFSAPLPAKLWYAKRLIKNCERLSVKQISTFRKNVEEESFRSACDGFHTYILRDEWLNKKKLATLFKKAEIISPSAHKNQSRIKLPNWDFK